MPINRKLQFFAIRALRAGRLACFLTACALLLLAPFSHASINIPTPPPEKKSSEKKKKDAPPPRPPMPVPVAVQVQNGGTVQVALRVYGRQEQTTNYLIRKEPALGKIVSLEPAEREVWILTYQHTSPMNGQLSQQDRILFAAQNKNGTSSAAEISLTIADNPPELSIQDSIEFGEVAVGIASSKSITITNKGGGTLEGNLTVDAPWSIEPTAYKLAHDQHTSLTLTLTPDAEREYQGHLRLSSDLETVPTLRALATAPFTVEPAALELAGDSKNPARSASFTLANRTATALTLEVAASERLHLPAQVVLPPKAKTLLKPTLEADDKAGMDETIRLSFGTVSRRISVHAASLLRKAAPPLNPLPQATETPSPTSIASLSSLFPTPPPTPAKTGGVPNAPPPTPNTAAESAVSIFDTLPKITGATVVRTTADGTAEFAWDRPLLPAAIGEACYRMEIRRLSFDANGKLSQNWIPIPGVEYSRTENRITGLLTGIPPGVSETAHVVALTVGGEPCAVSIPLPFHISAPFQVFTLRNVLLVGFILLLTFAFALHFKEKWSE